MILLMTKKPAEKEFFVLYAEGMFSWTLLLPEYAKIVLQMTNTKLIKALQIDATLLSI